MSDPFIGEIRLLPYSFAPLGWADCDGRQLSISENNALFALLGTAYGGNGQTTFGLPDLRGRVPLHQGTGPGLAPRNLGELGGSENVTLITSQMPAHSHAFSATSINANAAVPAPTNQFGDTGNDSFYTSDTQGATGTPTAPSMLLESGGSQPHENQMPTLTVRFCIATVGIFPSRP
ncbi:MAG TPA: tail fiber protein [Oleiagrimonas sp.]|nr:tail fiber protein [Oleiagrimonas sp.]